MLNTLSYRIGTYTDRAFGAVDSGGGGGGQCTSSNLKEAIGLAMQRLFRLGDFAFRRVIRAEGLFKIVKNRE